jgi:hypothetical protein
MKDDTKKRFPQRKFRPYDALILIATLAIGMGLTGFYLPEMFDNSKADLGGPTQWLLASFALVLACLPIPAALGVGIGVSRLLTPHPSRRRLACQPGFVACLANSFGVVVIAASLLVISVYKVDEVLRFQLPRAMLAKIHLPMIIGPGVICGWALLVIGKRWCPEPSWVDRAGRALGVFWISWFVLEVIRLVI